MFLERNLQRHRWTLCKAFTEQGSQERARESHKSLRKACPLSRLPATTKERLGNPAEGLMKLSKKRSECLKAKNMLEKHAGST